MEAIHDHAIIGDCRSAALVSRRGSIDWLCWPRFDSPSLFGALLDDSAGRWQISPSGAFEVEREYIDRTNVLQTRFRTQTGTLVLTDLMPVASEEEKHALLVPEHELLRIAECEEGEVDLEMAFDPKPGYGRRPARLRETRNQGLRVDIGNGLLVLRCNVPYTIGGHGARCRVRIKADDVAYFSLTFADEEMGILPPLGEFSRSALGRSVRWWRQWLSAFRYEGPMRDAVVRSALVLKLLVYAPSGAVVAAPTTSLPERVGGDSNWDYRFCWLRDASLTVRALFGLGFADEGKAFVSWLLQSTRLTRPELRTLYDVYGNKPRREETLERFTGYFGSRPVRTGNAAADQLQLDVYGEVIDAATYFVRAGGSFDRETQRMLRDFGKYVCKNWERPDEGIWEPRSGRSHNTYSRVLCWTALDRLIDLAEKGHVRRIPMDRFRENRASIRREVETRAWNQRLGTYVSKLDGEELDASLLRLAWYGFESASSHRMRATHAKISEQLSAGNGLLYRLRTVGSNGEGAFGICSFWGAEYLALGGGTLSEAQEVFERLCVYANDVGLFGEEIDPATGQALGNFPQAFTHVGLINTALTIAHRRAEEHQTGVQA